MKRFKGITSLTILILMIRFSLNKGDIWGETKTSYYIMSETFMYFLTAFNFCLDIYRMRYKDFYLIYFKGVNPTQLERDEAINIIIK